ncbi:MAG: PEGA domain-containing protein [Phycisphaerales bacterium]|nr:PEGA domain-containing protein [Planctomycetota bacterium]
MNLARPAIALLTFCLAGCSQRVIEITSEPSGALVTLNDVQLGRTPLQTDFTFYGDYDILLTKPGYEPLRTKATANTPIYERVPLDLATSPIPYESVVRWHYKLQPTLESTQAKQQFEDDLIGRARGLRDQVDDPAAIKPAPPAKDAPASDKPPPAPPPSPV